MLFPFSLRGMSLHWHHFDRQTRLASVSNWHGHLVIIGWAGGMAALHCYSQPPATACQIVGWLASVTYVMDKVNCNADSAVLLHPCCFAAMQLQGLKVKGE